jgi:hypothetical protein
MWTEHPPEEALEVAHASDLLRGQVERLEAGRRGFEEVGQPADSQKQLAAEGPSRAAEDESKGVGCHLVAPRWGERHFARAVPFEVRTLRAASNADETGC